MKRLSKAFLAVLMAVLMGVLPTVKVLADDTPSAEYVSEVKVFFGDPAAAAAEGRGAGIEASTVQVKWRQEKDKMRGRCRRPRCIWYAATTTSS